MAYSRPVPFMYGVGGGGQTVFEPRDSVLQQAADCLSNTQNNSTFSLFDVLKVLTPLFENLDRSINGFKGCKCSHPPLSYSQAVSSAPRVPPPGFPPTLGTAERPRSPAREPHIPTFPPAWRNNQHHDYWALSGPTANTPVTNNSWRQVPKRAGRPRHASL